MRVVQLLVLVALVASASAAVKYATNTGSPVGTAAAYTTGPAGNLPQDALEWFRYDPSTSCYRLWAPSPSAACTTNLLPGPTDDVILGYGTGQATAGEFTINQAIYFSFNHPRLNCAAGSTAAGGCTNFGSATVTQQARDNWNANISTLTFRAFATTTTSANAALYPIQFTGYPQTTGVFDAAANTWTVVRSTKLSVINGVFINHPNFGLYGSGYGVSAGGVSYGADGASIGNAAFSAPDVYGEDDRAGARNALHTTTAIARTWQAVAANEAAYLAGYGFILETPSILVDSCQYGTTATTRCTAWAATEIQGPNLYIQPVVNLTYSVATATPDYTFTGRRVNITVARGSALFTTAVNYINVDFYIQYDGVLGFCEPSRRNPGGAAAGTEENTGSNGFSQFQAASVPLSATDAAGNSYSSRANVICSPVATAALDWFGTAFTSVRIFNADFRADNVRYSEVLPNLAKLVIMYGSAYTVPVVGNVTIEILAREMLDTTEQTPVATAADVTNSGRPTVAGTGTDPLLPDTATAGIARGRSRAFIGMAIPFGDYRVDAAGTAASNEIPFVQSFDCSAVLSLAAPTPFSESITSVVNTVCDGLHTPTRFTFFGGVATIQKLTSDVGNTLRQLIALTQFDLIVAGDGNSAAPASLVFGQLSNAGQGYQLCGHFAARSNGAIRFSAAHSVLLSSKLGLLDTVTGIATVRRFGQDFTQQPAVAAAPALASAAYPYVDPAPTTAISAATQTPIPRRATACAARYTWAQTGSGCTLGTYSFLYTVPVVAPAVAERPVVAQFNCVAGTCTATAASTVDEGCYTSGTLTAGTLAPEGAAAGTRGYCATFAGATATATTQQTVPALCPLPSFSGLAAFPSSAVSNVTVGQIVFNSPVTVNDVNATFSATTAVVRSSFTVASFVNVDGINVALDATLPSSTVINNQAVLLVDGASASVTTDAASTLDVSAGGVINVNGGSLAGGNFRTAGGIVFTSGSIQPTAGVNTVFSGAGYIRYSSATVAGTVLSSVANSTVVGALNVPGTYTQTAGNFTVLDGAVIGSTVATSSFVLSGSANLVFAAPTTGVAVGSAIAASGPVAHLSVSLASAANQVIIPVGADVTASVPVTIADATGVVTTAQVVVAGDLELQQASTITANVLVTGELLGSPNFVITLAGNTTVSGSLGHAGHSFQIGSGSRRGILRLNGGKFAGQYALQTSSFVVISGRTNVSEATTVSAASGVTATSTVASSVQGNSVALFADAGSELIISAPFTSNVDIVNAGTITVAANQVLTVQGGRTLRLRNGVVTGAGSVVIAAGTPAGAVVVDSGANNALTPASLTNNAVITVAAGATLTVTSCVAGSGSIQGLGQVIFTTNTGCLSSTGVSRLVNLQLNAGTTTTVGGGLTILTTQISGNGVIVANGGFIAINNNNGLTLTVTGTPQVGSATGAQDGVVIAGTITTGANTLILGASTVGIRSETAPFALTTSGVTATLNGNLQLVGTLVVPVGASLSATGVISGTGALTVQGQLTVVNALQVSVPTVTVTGTLIGSTASSVLTLGANTVLALNAGATVGRITVTGGRVRANGAFTFGQNVTIASQFELTGSLVIPPNVTFRASGVVVCNNGATITAQPGGRVIFETFYVGCVVSGDAFSGPGLPGNGTSVVNATISGNLVIGVAGFTIPQFTNITVTGPTRVVCTATVCTITVAGNLTIPFAFVCYDNLGATNPAVISSCPLGGIFSTNANVIVTITGTITFVSGASATVTTQDLPTYPVGTFGTLNYGPTAHTIIIATGTQINPVIVLNTITLGGTLEVFTQSFVPLRPTVIFRALNQGNAARGVTGAFSSVVIHYDQARSAHPWAWNVGFPTVRVVNNDVVLDPNGNGTNGASAAVPSFVVALLAVVAAFFLRK